MMILKMLIDKEALRKSIIVFIDGYEPEPGYLTAEQAHKYLLIRETKIAEITEPMTIREVSDLLRGCDDTNIS